jgi:hypothetical protein
MKHRLPLVWLWLYAPLICTASPGNPQNAPNNWYNISSVGVQGIEFIHCDPNINPSLLIRNDGEKRLRNCKITYQFDNDAPRTFNWSGNLASGETAVIPVPGRKMRLGRHAFQFSCSLPNGRTDVFSQNNTFPAKIFYISQPSTEIPLYQGFQGRSFVGFNSLITRDNTRDGISWELKNGIGAQGKSGKSLGLNLCDATIGATDEFYLPAMNLTGVMHPQLDFQYAFWQRLNESRDRLAIQYSTDCGDTWTTAWDRRGADLATKAPHSAPWSLPFRNDWKSISVDLQELANQPAVLLRFAVTNDRGNAFFLDNISVGNASTLAAWGVPASLPELIIAPNPNSGRCRITVQNADAGDYLLKVVNQLGQIVYIEAVSLSENQAYSTELNLYHLPGGNYPLIIAREGQPPLLTKQILIQRS